MRDYAGQPFESLILPRIQEATKEVTAQKTAADIVKTREQKDADRKRREEAEAATVEQPKKRGLFGRGKKEEAPVGATAETDAASETDKPKAQTVEKKPRKARAKDEADKGSRSWTRGKSGPGSSPRKTRGSQRGQ